LNACTRRGLQMEFLLLLFFWLMMAGVVAMVGKSKGRSAAPWFFYGLLLWPIALVHALLLRQAEGTTPGLGAGSEKPRATLLVDSLPRLSPDISLSPAMRASYEARVAEHEAKVAATQAVPDPLDTETLRVAAEWRAAGRQFSMVDAKEEARLQLLEKASQSPQGSAPAASAEKVSNLSPDPFRVAAFPGSFPQAGPSKPPGAADDVPSRPRQH
jgi:hypothetical protein